jgi:sulfur-carrier protein
LATESLLWKLMQIKVIAFGKLADILGKSSITLHNIPNTDQLKLQLHRLYPLLKLTKYQIVIDQKTIDQNVALIDQNMVALLPAATES